MFSLDYICPTITMEKFGHLLKFILHFWQVIVFTSIRIFNRIDSFLWTSTYTEFVKRTRQNFKNS